MSNRTADTTMSDKPAVYFSARRLIERLGGPAGLLDAMERRFGLRLKRGVVWGWMQRDQVPGQFIAQIMVAEPRFPVRDLIAERQDVPPAASNPLVKELLS